jgi:ABC-type Fe3+-siderophore transport system permease subunit
MTHKELLKRFFWIAAFLGAALLVIGFLFAKGVIQPRLFAWIVLAPVAVAYVAFYRLFKRAREERRS